MIHLVELPSQARAIQSGLFDSRIGALTGTIPTTQAEIPPAPKPKAVRKKKEAAAEAAQPESKPKEKTPRKKKDTSAPVAAPAPVPVPVSAPAPVSAAAAPAPSAAAPKSKAKFAKGSQEAKDYMAAIRAKRGAAKAAVEKAGATPATSEADDAAVVKNVAPKKKAAKAEKVENEMLA